MKYSKEALENLSRTLKEGKNCSHPEEYRQTIGFGIFCMKCKCRISLLSKKDAEEKILNDLDKFFK